MTKTDYELNLPPALRGEREAVELAVELAIEETQHLELPPVTSVTFRRGSGNIRLAGVHYSDYYVAEVHRGGELSSFKGEDKTKTVWIRGSRRLANISKPSGRPVIVDDRAELVPDDEMVSAG